MFTLFCETYSICEREGFNAGICLLTALAVTLVLGCIGTLIGGFVWWWVLYFAGYTFTYWASCGVSLAVYVFGPYALPFILNSNKE